MLEGIQVKRGQRGWNRGNKRRKTGWIGARGELGGREIGDPQSVSLTRGSPLTMGARNERKE